MFMDALINSNEKNRIVNTVIMQIQSLWDISDIEVQIVESNIDQALERSIYCFGHVNEKYNDHHLNTLNTIQWFVFLYYLTNTIFKNSNGDLVYISLCDKIYSLYKSLSSCEVYYAVDLPSVFYCAHPMGTVIGRGVFSDGLYFYQGCTIGSNECSGGIYPRLGKNVLMFANSSIIGNCNVGNNVVFSINSYIKDMDIPDNTIVYGQYPNCLLKPNDTDIITSQFKL